MAPTEALVRTREVIIWSNHRLKMQSAAKVANSRRVDNHGLRTKHPPATKHKHNSRQEILQEIAKTVDFKVLEVKQIKSSAHKL